MRHWVMRRWDGILGGVLLAVAAWLFYLFQWPVKPPFETVVPNEDSVYFDTGVLIVQRTINVHDETDVTVHRELSASIQGMETKWTLPSSEVTLRKGKYTARRVIELPPIAPGTYRMTNRICFRVNAVRDSCASLPPLPVEIK